MHHLFSIYWKFCCQFFFYFGNNWNNKVLLLKAQVYQGYFWQPEIVMTVLGDVFFKTKFNHFLFFLLCNYRPEKIPEKIWYKNLWILDICLFLKLFLVAWSDYHFNDRSLSFVKKWNCKIFWVNCVYFERLRNSFVMKYEWFLNVASTCSFFLIDVRLFDGGRFQWLLLRV